MLFALLDSLMLIVITGIWIIRPACYFLRVIHFLSLFIASCDSFVLLVINYIWIIATLAINPVWFSLPAWYYLWLDHYFIDIINYWFIIEDWYYTSLILLQLVLLSDVESFYHYDAIFTMTHFLFRVIHPLWFIMDIWYLSIMIL